MLLVDHREAELVEGRVLFGERVGSDDDPRRPAAHEPLGVGALA